MKNIPLLLALVASTLFLAGCVQGGAKPSPTPNPGEIVSASATPTPTVSQGATPTPEIAPEGEFDPEQALEENSGEYDLPDDVSESDLENSV